MVRGTASSAGGRGGHPPAGGPPGARGGDAPGLEPVEASATEFPELLQGAPSVTKRAYDAVPLASRPAATRGAVLTHLVRELDERRHPDAVFADAEPGRTINGDLRGKHQAPYDWLRGEVRVACKTSLLRYDKSTSRWIVKFTNVKLAHGDEPAAFDELQLALMTPRGVYLYRHGLEAGVSTRGKRTASAGHAIQFRGACGEEDWEAALNQILSKMEQLGCERLAMVRWAP